MAYKVELQYSDGTSEFEDELFETEDAAYDHGNYLVSCHDLGSEILHLSNPGDYPDPDNSDELEFKVVEADD